MEREEIIAAFTQALDEWHTSYKVRPSKDGGLILSFGMKIESKIPHVFALFDFRKTSCRIFAIGPGIGPAQNLSEMLRLVAMVNQDMDAGCFEFEMASRSFRFRFFFDCEGFETLHPDLVRNTLLLPFQSFQRVGDAFLAVATGESDAASAFAEVQKRHEEEEDD